MKYAAIVAVAVFSLILAIPLSKQSVKQQNDLSFNTVATKVAVKSVVQPTTTHETASVTVTQPTPASVAYLASYRCTAYQSDFEQYNWNVDVAMAICQAESSGNPYAVSNADINTDGLPDYGLMQIHNIDIINPAANIAYAYYHKYLTQGWGAWSTYNSGKYAQFL